MSPQRIQRVGGIAGILKAVHAAKAGVQRAGANIDNGKTRSAGKGLGRSIQALAKFRHALGSRGGRQLSP